MLQSLRRALDRSDAAPEIHWLTGSGQMGADALRDAGFDGYLAHPVGGPMLTFGVVATR